MLTERLLNMGCMCVLATMMAAFNPQFGQVLTGALSGDSATITEYSGRALALTRTVSSIATTYASDNSQMVMFALSAVVLFGLMLRN